MSMSKAKAENRELPRRFYTHAGVSLEKDGWQVTLDARPVKTPAKNALSLPNEHLAMAVASEWEAQEEVINPFTMPLTRICHVALDRMADIREGAAEEIARFAGTDLLCHRSDDAALAERQAALWDRYLDWSAMALDAPLNTTDKLAAIDQPESSILALKNRALALDDFRLTGLVSAVPILTSAVLGFVLLEDEDDVESLWKACQLEVDYQIEKWGEDAEAQQAAQNRKTDLISCGRLFRMLDSE